MNTQSKDVFDVYGDYSHITPIPLQEAVQKFKEFFGKTYVSTELPREQLEHQRIEIELLLFRSVIAHKQID
jgi:hypothetical protein